MGTNSNSSLENARRLLDLDVREISLVDRPAIKREFVIVKRLADAGDPEALALVVELQKRFCELDLEEDSFVFEVEKAKWTTAYINDLPDSSFLYVESGGKKDADGKTTPRTLRHFPVKDKNGKIDLPHVRNALARIPQSNVSAEAKTRATAAARRLLTKETKKSEFAISLSTETNEALTRLSKGLQESKLDGMDPAISFINDVLEGKLPVMKGDDMTTENNAAAQGSENATPAVSDNASSQEAVNKSSEGQQNAETSGEAKKPEEVIRTKSVEDSAEVPAIQVMQDGSVIVSGQPVQKGRTFTQARINTLMENASALTNLLKEVDPDGLAELVDKLAQELPTDTQYRQGVNATPTPGAKKDKPRRGMMMKNEDGTTQDEEDPIFKAIENLSNTVGALVSKVETIEKARSPSTSVNADGGTDDNTQNVEKSATKAGSSDFWKGTLF